MPRLPTVAIIGRPNTGKSTLFNRLIGRRKAIESATAGTTRDRLAATKEGKELDYILIDTGGIGGGTEDKNFEADVEKQSILAIENADMILFTVNGQEPLTKSDFTVAEILRKRRRGHVPVMLILTKCDNPEKIDEILPPYYELGIAEEIFPISAPQRTGIEALESKIEQSLLSLNFVRVEKSTETAPRIAIVGKPNVGKSSLVNAFMSDTEREKSALIVSDIAGTTRDSTDTVIRYHDKDYVFTDTAGIRKNKTAESDIAAYSYFRTVREIEECDVTVLVVDATEPISRQDKRIAGQATEEGKGLVVLLNKIDLISKEQKAARMQQLAAEFRFCRFAPVLPVSAVTREGLLKIFELIEMAVRNRNRRLSTKDLHDWFRKAVYSQPVGELAKSKHITQAEDVPPTFVIFVRHPNTVQVTQLRYLENSLRKMFAFEGSPIRWVMKGEIRE